MANKKSSRRALVYCAGIAVALVSVYVILVVTGIISLDSYAEELMTIPNLSGMEFKIIYTSRARLFVTDDAVSVYTRRAAVDREPLLRGGRTGKLFCFVMTRGGMTTLRRP
jgi:hypothetical protein